MGRSLSFLHYPRQTITRRTNLKRCWFGHVSKQDTPANPNHDKRAAFIFVIASAASKVQERKGMNCLSLGALWWTSGLDSCPPTLARGCPTNIHSSMKSLASFAVLGTLLVWSFGSSCYLGGCLRLLGLPDKVIRRRP